MGAHTERRMIDRRKMHYGKETVSLATGGSSGSSAVTFTSAYDVVPGIFVVTPRGAAGTYTYSNESASGFTMRITGETDTDFASDRVMVFFFCHER
jgi:hypothetical protein